MWKVMSSPIVWFVFSFPKLGNNELHEPTIPVSVIRSAKMCAKTNRSQGRDKDGSSLFAQGHLFARRRLSGSW